MSLEKVRNIPVVNDNLKLVGLVTYRELIKALTKKSSTMRVADIMIGEVKTVSPDTPLKEAIQLMVVNKFGCLPVIDANRKLIGVVTEMDLLRDLSGHVSMPTDFYAVR